MFMQDWIADLTDYEKIWVGVGLVGQTLFFMRFMVQWLASEKARRSVMPDMFWYFSIGGGFILFLYAIHRQDPVFTLGQGLGLLIYARNIYFVKKAKDEKQS